MNSSQLNAESIVSHLKSLADPVRAAGASRFFKSGEGEYGEGVLFIGLSNPVVREEVKRFNPLSLGTCESLLHNEIHEIRFFALSMLVELFKPKRSELKEAVVSLYLKNTRHINNWDLVDCSAYKILGEYLLDKDRDILFKLAKSDCLWERRISIVSNYAFIKRGDFQTTLDLAEILKNDKEDLMHKALGWMLKEVGKRNQKLLVAFVEENASELPRTLLRTAIEKLPQSMRKSFLRA